MHKQIDLDNLHFQTRQTHCWRMLGIFIVLFMRTILQILNPLTSPTIVTSNQRGTSTVVTSQHQHLRQNMQNGRTTLATHSTSHPTITRNATLNHTLKRNSIPCTDEPEYILPDILPDSSMTEISLQVSPLAWLLDDSEFILLDSGMTEINLQVSSIDLATCTHWRLTRHLQAYLREINLLLLV